MIDLTTYNLYLITAMFMVISPGPDTILILSRTIASGTKPGLMTLAGTQTGNVIHALLAGLGVSTILLVFPIVFEVLKYAGAAYLLYLAWSTWNAPNTLVLDGELSRNESTLRYFQQGLANNLVNPKMIPFFVALFPQFIKPESGSVVLQSAILGVTLALMALLWIGSLVIIVGRFRTVASANPTFLKLANRLAAITFFGLACRLAIDQKA